MIEVFGSLPSAWEMREESWTPAWAWPTPGCCGHLRIDPVDEKSASLSTFQIKRITNEG